MTVKEAIKKISFNQCYSIWDAEEYLEGDYKLVARDLEIARHRWHETSVNVYKLDDGYIGIWGLSKIYSELGTADDFKIQCEVDEYEEVQIISYQPKSIK